MARLLWFPRGLCRERLTALYLSVSSMCPCLFSAALTVCLVGSLRLTPAQLRPWSQIAIVAKDWAQRAVPDTMTMSLEDSAADTTPPKPKASRVKLFWKVGHGMD